MGGAAVRGGAAGTRRGHRYAPPPPPWGLGRVRGGGGDKLGWGHTRILDKAPTKAYKTKPQQTKQK